MNIETEVMKDGTESSLVYAPFDEGVIHLGITGYNLISLEENAGLRIREGGNSKVSTQGNWVREGILYVPKKGRFLTKKSPIMQNLVEATNAHRNGTEFYLNDRQVEEALEDSVEIPKGEGRHSLRIPTNEFGEDEVARYAFGETAKQYGEFLGEAGIKEMPIYTSSLQDEPFVKSTWFGGLNGRSPSAIVGDGWYLCSAPIRLRGIRKATRYNPKFKLPSEPARLTKSPVSNLPSIPNFEGMADSDFEGFLKYVGANKK
jgi:hypothetical protein